MYKLHKISPYNLDFFNLIYEYKISIMFTNKWIIFKLIFEDGDENFSLIENKKIETGTGIIP